MYLLFVARLQVCQNHGTCGKFYFAWLSSEKRKKRMLLYWVYPWQERTLVLSIHWQEPNLPVTTSHNLMIGRIFHRLPFGSVRFKHCLPSIAHVYQGLRTCWCHNTTCGSAPWCHDAGGPRMTGTNRTIHARDCDHIYIYIYPPKPKWNSYSTQLPLRFQKYLELLQGRQYSRSQSGGRQSS